MRRVQKAQYLLKSSKIKQPLKFIFLSDLHSCYRENRKTLLSAFREVRPNAFLIGGDLLIRGNESSIADADTFLKDIQSIATVIMGFGNHEQKLDKINLLGYDLGGYENHLKKMGINILNNKNEVFNINGDNISIGGFCIPLEYYGRKGLKKSFEASFINEKIGLASRQNYQILLAHYPRFKEVYESWGCDLALSGHFHGGMIRLPFLGGVIDSNLRIFPPYTRGQFNKTIVTSGLGEHTIPLRINNPREFVVIEIIPE